MMPGKKFSWVFIPLSLFLIAGWVVWNFIVHPKYTAQILVGRGEYTGIGSYQSVEVTDEICPKIPGCKDAYDTDFGIYISFRSYGAAQNYASSLDYEVTVLRNIVYDFSSDKVDISERNNGHIILNNYEDPQ